MQKAQREGQRTQRPQERKPEQPKRGREQAETFPKCQLVFSRRREKRHTRCRERHCAPLRKWQHRMLVAVQSSRALTWCWWECKAILACQRFLTKLSTTFPYNPAITLLGIYPTELKTNVQTKTTAIFRIVKNWKHSKYLLISAWIHKCGTCLQQNIQ